MRATGVKQYQPRSALLIRAWHGLNWKPHHSEYLRALIMELSLHSGGEYQIYLLCHVKDSEMPIFSDQDHQPTPEFHPQGIQEYGSFFQ